MPAYHFDIVSALDLQGCPNVPVLVTEAQGFELGKLHPGLIAFIPFEVTPAVNINTHYYLDASLVFGLDADTYWSAITKDQFTAISKQRPDLEHTLLGGLSSSSRAKTERLAKRPREKAVAEKAEEGDMDMAQFTANQMSNYQKANDTLLIVARLSGITTGPDYEDYVSYRILKEQYLDAQHRGQIAVPLRDIKAVIPTPAYRKYGALWEYRDDTETFIRIKSRHDVDKEGNLK